MSRTYMHRPLKLDYDYRADDVWRYEYRKRYNTKNNKEARRDRRRIRHAKTWKELVNALMEYKRNIFAWDRYW